MARDRKCLILSAHYGLIDRRVVAQANLLASQQREVTLVSVPAEGCQSLVPGVKVVMANSTPSAGEGKLKRLRRLARHLPRPIKTGLHSLAWMAGVSPLPRFSEYFCSLTPPGNYDVIHCHDLQTLPAGLCISERMAPKARVIYDSHELFPFQFPAGRMRSYWTAVESQHIKRADAIITVNESIADDLAERYAVSRPLVLSNSCHLDVRNISDQMFQEHFGLADGMPSNAFRILFQGGFIREKNVESLAQAFAALGSGFQLFLLGGGMLEPRLRRLASRNAVKNIHFGNWVNGEQLLGYVAHAHGGIIPYLDEGLPNNHYCTPNKLFEYLQAGVPICAGDLPELRRIVQGENIGGVYTLRTASDIASALSDFAGRCRAGEFTPGAFATAREKYSWQRQAQRLLNLYEQLGV